MPPSYGVGDPKFGFAPMDWERVRRRLESARNYWISTASADGIPAAFRLRPVKAMAWQESDFPKTAARWRFRQPPH